MPRHKQRTDRRAKILRLKVLANVTEHCRQVYKRGSRAQQGCLTGAAIAAAEIEDVSKELRQRSRKRRA